MRLLESANVVGPVTAHEREAPPLLERPQNRFLVLRGHACPHLDVADNVPRANVLVRRSAQAVARDAQVVPLRAQLPHRRGRVGDGGVSLLEGGARRDPLQSSGGGEAEEELLEVVASRDPHVARHVQGRERRVARRHGHGVRGCPQLLDHLGRVAAHEARKGHEATQLQALLNLLPRRALPPRGALLGLALLGGGQGAPREGEDAHPLLCECPVCLLEPSGGSVLEEFGHGFGRALDQRVRLGHPVATVHGSEHRHALEFGGEVVAVQNAERGVGPKPDSGVAPRRRHLFGGVIAPAQRLEPGRLDRVSQHAPAHLDERVAGSEDVDARERRVGQRGGVGLWGGPRAPRPDAHQLVRGEGSGLVEERMRHLASERDTEGLGAEDGSLEESEHRRVDRHGRLHRKFGRDDGGEDQDAAQDQLVLRPLPLAQPLFHDMPRGGNCEEEEEEKQRQHLLRVRQNRLLRILDHPYQLALRG
mmetsp:Transcript_9976/g.24389  ORF Transcript_9976/g.24389 Transcript_9976/m.24389 type:complete len:477 (+) Transcript_9976:1716-3146(+)